MKIGTAFSEFELSQDLTEALNSIGFKVASEVQELTFNDIMAGEDLFVQAKTGSGKTGAFVIPMLEKLYRNNKERKTDFYLIISPTRELAQQTFSLCETLGAKLGIVSSCLIGGEDIDKQKSLLASGVQILVGTPGRLHDLLRQKIISPDTCQGVVLDEADRLFDMGFKTDIEAIFSRLPKSRQLVMVSATNNMDVLNVAYKYHSHPKEIKIDVDELVVEKIDHKIAMITRQEKMPFLVNLLRKNEDVYAMVFCNTQHQTHFVAEWLCSNGLKAKPISGRLPQSKRTRLMDEFREKKTTILVCTDVAARGLDVKDLTLVINYDLPNEAANYVHRIGRTGRAGKSGEAISFCGHEDCENIDQIYKLVGKIPAMDITDDDFAKGLTRKPMIDKKTLKLIEPHRKPQEARPLRKPKNQTSPQRDTKEKGDVHERKERSVNTQTNTDKRVPRPPRDMSYQITTTQIQLAEEEAKTYFNINDNGLLGHEVLSLGSKKYLFFGPRKTTYKFFVRPIYKRLLTPFLIELMKKMQLKVHVRVSYRDNMVKVYFSGADEKMLTNNNNELLYSFEQLMKSYLSRKIVVSRSLKFSLRIQNEGHSPRNSSQGGNGGRFKEKQEKQLQELASELRDRVLEDRKTATTKTLNPAERRIIHEYFKNDPQFKTTSLGDGRFKKIEISLA